MSFDPFEHTDPGEHEDPRDELVIPPSDPPMDNHAAQRVQTRDASGHTRSSTGNGEARMSDEDVIKEAIREIRKYDRDKNGRITNNDIWLAAFDLNKDGEATPEERRQAIFDLNKNGEITEEERKKVADLNEDGHVTKDEYNQAFKTKADALFKAHLKAFKDTLTSVRDLNPDVDTVVKVIHDLAADKELDIAEAFVLQSIYLSPSARVVVLAQIDQDIKSGVFDDVKCQIYKNQMLENCVVVVQKMVLAEYGIYVSEAALTIRALIDGTLEGPQEGMNPLFVGKILERFGIPTVELPYATIEQLENLRKEGRVPIIGLDADEIWRKDEKWVYDDNEDKGRGDNHVVVFIRVDRSDPDNPMVIVNDSGTKDGKESAIPLDRFMDAWADAGNYAVVTTEPVPPLQCEMSPSTMTEQERNERFRNR